jgi:hypothetical protein
MVVEEAARFAEVIAQSLHSQQFAGLPLDHLGPPAPEELEHVPHPADDVVRVVRVVDQDAVPGDAERVLLVRDGGLEYAGFRRQGTGHGAGDRLRLADRADVPTLKATLHGVAPRAVRKLSFIAAAIKKT